MKFKIHKRKTLFAAFFCTVALGACGRAPAVHGTGDVSAELVPAHYTETVENVTFDLAPEVAAGIDVSAILKAKIKGLHSNDADAAYAAFAEGKTVSEQSINPANQYRTEERHYRFADGSALNAGGNSASFSTANSDYYTSLLDKISADLPKNALPFATPEETMQAARDAVRSFGYDSDIAFDYVTLTAAQAQTMEEHTDKSGNIDMDAYKSAWMEEDDAYILYGTLVIGGLPVFAEMNLLGQIMALDIPYNAPVHAVYTSRGPEWFYVMTQYDYELSGETVTLLPFQTAAHAVSDKLNGVLSPAPYEVYRAKLFLMVHMDAAQSYSADPIWYFEVRDPQDEDPLVVLVDAVNGSEVPIS